MKAEHGRLIPGRLNSKPRAVEYSYEPNYTRGLRAVNLLTQEKTHVLSSATGVKRGM